jgi:hypothetical protein
MSNEFLTARLFMKERLDAGVDVHPSDDELREFQKIAKTIDADRYFTLYGCQDCVNTLVRFVFANYKDEPLIVKKETFPKHEQSSNAEAED